MKQLNKSTYAVIVAGGSGTRLWPMSRKDLPKQMQKFVSDKTLIDETYQRLIGVFRQENIYVATTANYKDKIQELLPDIASENIIVEPEARGTTAAFALFAATIAAKDPEATIFSLASDHAVTDVEKFQTTIRHAVAEIEEHPKQIAIVGIKPTRADTGLGYIKIGKPVNPDHHCYMIEKFVEKPSHEVAKVYYESGDYLWNTAYYCFKAKTLIAAYTDADSRITDGVKSFLKSGEISDFQAIPTKAHEIEIINSQKFPMLGIAADFDWSDIGNWQALHALLQGLTGKDLIDNSSSHIDINSSNCLIMAQEDKLIATVGLDNIVVVETPDVLLVMNKEQPQEIKELLNLLKAKGLDKYL